MRGVPSVGELEAAIVSASREVGTEGFTRRAAERVLEVVVAARRGYERGRRQPVDDDVPWPDDGGAEDFDALVASIGSGGAP